MRELTQNEIEEVSGGLDGKTFMKGLGYAVGGAVMTLAASDGS